MGASGWEYCAPYQEDLGAALDQLRQTAFEEGDYFWDPWDDELPAGPAKPRPRTIDELWADESVQESGTHSILDMDKVIGPHEDPDYFTVQLISAKEARQYAGTDRLTRAHIEAIQPLASRRWFGRCAVLHNDQGQPEEIYFWGFSGD